MQSISPVISWRAVQGLPLAFRLKRAAVDPYDPEQEEVGIDDGWRDGCCARGEITERLSCVNFCIAVLVSALRLNKTK